jgi:hypothetical protein
MRQNCLYCGGVAWKGPRTFSQVRGPILYLERPAWKMLGHLCKPRVEGSSPFVSTKETAGQRLIELLACFCFGAVNVGSSGLAAARCVTPVLPARTSRTLPEFARPASGEQAPTLQCRLLRWQSTPNLSATGIVVAPLLGAVFARRHTRDMPAKEYVR